MSGLRKEELDQLQDTCFNPTLYALLLSFLAKKAKPPLKATQLIILKILHTVSPTDAYILLI